MSLVKLTCDACEHPWVTVASFPEEGRIRYERDICPLCGHVRFLVEDAEPEDEQI